MTPTPARKWPALLGTIGLCAAMFVAVCWTLGLGGAEPAKRPIPTELDFLPHHIEFVATLDLAALRKTDAGKEAERLLSKKGILGDLFGRDISLKSTEMDRITFVSPRFDLRSSVVMVVVTTAEPLTASDVLKRVRATPVRRGLPGEELDGPVATNHADQPAYYLTGRVQTDLAVYIVDERTLAFVPASTDRHGSYLVSQFLRRKKEGARTEGLRLAGEHPLVLDFTVPGVPADVTVPVAFRPLLEARSARCFADVGKELVAEARMPFADAEAARKGEKSLKAAVALAAASLPGYKQEYIKDRPKESAAVAEFLDAIGAALDKLVIGTDGSEVTARVAVPPAFAVQAVAAFIESSEATAVEYERWRASRPPGTPRFPLAMTKK